MKKLIKLFVVLFVFLSILICHELIRNVVYSQECQNGEVVCSDGQVACCEKFKPHCKDGEAKCCKKKQDGSGWKCQDKDGNSYPVECKESCGEEQDEEDTQEALKEAESTDQVEEQKNEDEENFDKGLEESSNINLEKVNRALTNTTYTYGTNIYDGMNATTNDRGCGGVAPSCSECSQCTPSINRCLLKSGSDCGVNDGLIGITGPVGGTQNITLGILVKSTTMPSNTGLQCVNCKWQASTPTPATPTPTPLPGPSCTIPVSQTDPCPNITGMNCFQCLRNETTMCLLGDLNCYCGLASFTCQTDTDCSSYAQKNCQNCQCTTADSCTETTVSGVTTTTGICNPLYPGYRCGYGSPSLSATPECLIPCGISGNNQCGGGCSTKGETCSFTSTGVTTPTCRCSLPCSSTNLTGWCAAGQTCCNGTCCSSTQCANNTQCCQSGQSPCGGVCCASGQCANNTQCCQSGQSPCGGVCCASGQCANNVSGICCSTGETPCGGLCCSASQSSCINLNGNTPWCCAPTKVCGTGNAVACCRDDQTCNSTTGTCTTSSPPPVGGSITSPQPGICTYSPTLFGCINSLNIVGGDCGGGKTCKSSGLLNCGCN